MLSHTESSSCAEPIETIETLLQVLQEGCHNQKEQILNGIIKQKGTSGAWIGSGVGEVILSILVEGRDSCGDMISLSLCRLLSDALLHILRPVDRAIRAFFQQVLSILRSPTISVTSLLYTLTYLLASDPVALRIFLACEPVPVILHLYCSRLALPRVVSVDHDSESVINDSPTLCKSNNRMRVLPEKNKIGQSGEIDSAVAGSSSGASQQQHREQQNPELETQTRRDCQEAEQDDTTRIQGAGGLSIALPKLKLPTQEVSSGLVHPQTWKLVTKSGDNRPQLSSCRVSTTDLRPIGQDGYQNTLLNLGHKLGQLYVTKDLPVLLRLRRQICIPVQASPGRICRKGFTPHGRSDISHQRHPQRDVISTADEAYGEALKRGSNTSVSDIRILVVNLMTLIVREDPGVGHIFFDTFMVEVDTIIESELEQKYSSLLEQLQDIITASSIFASPSTIDPFFGRWSQLVTSLLRRTSCTIRSCTSYIRSLNGHIANFGFGAATNFSSIATAVVAIDSCVENVISMLLYCMTFDCFAVDNFTLCIEIMKVLKLLIESESLTPSTINIFSYIFGLGTESRKQTAIASWLVCISKAVLDWNPSLKSSGSEGSIINHVCDDQSCIVVITFWTGYIKMLCNSVQTLSKSSVELLSFLYSPFQGVILTWLVHDQLFQRVMFKVALLELVTQLTSLPPRLSPFNETSSVTLSYIRLHYTTMLQVYHHPQLSFDSNHVLLCALHVQCLVNILIIGGDNSKSKLVQLGAGEVALEEISLELNVENKRYQLLQQRENKERSQRQSGTEYFCDTKIELKTDGMITPQTTAPIIPLLRIGRTTPASWGIMEGYELNNNNVVPLQESTKTGSSEPRRLQKLTIPPLRLPSTPIAVSPTGLQQPIVPPLRLSPLVQSDGRPQSPIDHVEKTICPSLAKQLISDTILHTAPCRKLPGLPVATEVGHKRNLRTSCEHDVETVPLRVNNMFNVGSKNLLPLKNRPIGEVKEVKDNKQLSKITSQNGGKSPESPMEFRRSSTTNYFNVPDRSENQQRTNLRQCSTASDFTKQNRTDVEEHVSQLSINSRNSLVQGIHFEKKDTQNTILSAPSMKSLQLQSLTPFSKKESQKELKSPGGSSKQSDQSYVNPCQSAVSLTESRFCENNQTEPPQTPKSSISSTEESYSSPQVQIENQPTAVLGTSELPVSSSNLLNENKLDLLQSPGKSSRSSKSLSSLSSRRSSIDPSRDGNEEPLEDASVSPGKKKNRKRSSRAGKYRSQKSVDVEEVIGIPKKSSRRSRRLKNRQRQSGACHLSEHSENDSNVYISVLDTKSAVTTDISVDSLAVTAGSVVSKLSITGSDYSCCTVPASPIGDNCSANDKVRLVRYQNCVFPTATEGAVSPVTADLVQENGFHPPSGNESHVMNQSEPPMARRTTRVSESQVDHPSSPTDTGRLRKLSANLVLAIPTKNIIKDEYPIDILEDPDAFRDCERETRPLYRYPEIHTWFVVLVLSIMSDGSEHKTLSTSFFEPSHYFEILLAHLNDPNNSNTIPLIIQTISTLPKCIKGKLHTVVKLLTAMLYPGSSVFQPLDRIGIGAYGSVSTCSPKGSVSTAIKQVTASSSNFLEVCSEVLICKKLRSAGVPVLPILDFGFDGFSYCIVTPLAQNSLKGYLCSCSNDGYTLVKLFSKVVRAVKEIHNNNVIHMDLKCENVLVVGCQKTIPEIKICDFGESAFVDELRRVTSRPRGTECVRPPEMLIAMASDFDRRKGEQPSFFTQLVDVWGIGCLLFELLTNEYLFSTEDYPAFYAHVTLSEYPILLPAAVVKCNNIVTGSSNVIQAILVRQPTMRISIKEVDVIVDELLLTLEPRREIELPVATGSSKKTTTTQRPSVVAQSSFTELRSAMCFQIRRNDSSFPTLFSSESIPPTPLSTTAVFAEGTSSSGDGGSLFEVLPNILFGSTSHQVRSELDIGGLSASWVIPKYKIKHVVTLCSTEREKSYLLNYLRVKSFTVDCTHLGLDLVSCLTLKRGTLPSVGVTAVSQKSATASLSDAVRRWEKCLLDIAKWASLGESTAIIGPLDKLWLLAVGYLSKWYGLSTIESASVSATNCPAFTTQVRETDRLLGTSSLLHSGWSYHTECNLFKETDDHRSRFQCICGECCYSTDDTGNQLNLKESASLHNWTSTYVSQSDTVWPHHMHNSSNRFVLLSEDNFKFSGKVVLVKQHDQSSSFLIPPPEGECNYCSECGYVTYVIIKSNPTSLVLVNTSIPVVEEEIHDRRPIVLMKMLDM